MVPCIDGRQSGEHAFGQPLYHVVAELLDLWDGQQVYGEVDVNVDQLR